MNVEVWKSSTKSIWMGVLLYYVGDIVADILGMVNGVSGAADMMSSLASSGSISSGVGFLDVVEWLVKIGVIAGAVIYFLGIREFREAVAEADKPAASRLYNALILLIIGAVVVYIPILGWIAAVVLNILYMIFMIMAFGAMKSSSTFPSPASQGAASLKTAMILTIIANVVGIIPLVGAIPALILNIIAFFMLISGWSKFKAEQVVA